MRNLFRPRPAPCVAPAVRHDRVRVAAITLAVTLAAAGAPCAVEWDPVDPALLAQAASTIDKDAHAEIVFERVRVQESPVASRTTTLRVKVFDRQGIDAFGDFRLPDGRIEARTIRPDGTIVPLDPKSILKMVPVKGSYGLRVTRRSIVMPDLLPGSVIDLRWTTSSRGVVVRDTLDLSAAVPAREITYDVRTRYRSVARTFNAPEVTFTPIEGGYHRVTIRDVPPIEREPLMPPDRVVKPWILIAVQPRQSPGSKGYWADEGRDLHAAEDDLAKPTDPVREVAASVLAGASDDMDRLARLRRHVAKTVRRTDLQEDYVSERDEERLGSRPTAAAVLRRKAGDAHDSLIAFVALARAAGFDARLARAADRSEGSFTRAREDVRFLSRDCAAVKLGGAWRLLAPQETNVPFGLLPWEAEGTDALVADPKSGFIVATPLTPAAVSCARRTGAFELHADGSLDGNVHVELSGHLATAARDEREDADPHERDQLLRDQAVGDMGPVDVSGVSVESADDPDVPFGISARVQVSAAAERVGRRLLLRPSVLRRGAEPPLKAATRKLPVWFPHPMSEIDLVTIEVPAGFEPESPTAPAPLRLADSGTLDVTMTWNAKRRQLTLRRELVIGRDGTLIFPPEDHAAVKGFLDSVAASDQHVISLVRTEDGSRTP